MIRTPEQVKAELQEYAFSAAVSDGELGRKGGVMIGAMDKIFINPAYRHLVWMWLWDGTQPLHTHDLDNAMQMAMFLWLGSYKDDGEWKLSSQFVAEARMVLAHVVQLARHDPDFRGKLQAAGWNFMLTDLVQGQLPIAVEAKLGRKRQDAPLYPLGRS